MEAGKVLAKDVLPLVAIEMAKVANNAGALDAKYKTARVSQGRFFKELESAMGGKGSIFASGMDSGIGDFFSSLAEALAENKEVLQALGKSFKVFFNILAGAIRVLTPIVSSLTLILGTAIGLFDNLFGNGHGQYVVGIMAIAGAVAYLGKVMSKKLVIVTAIVAGLTEMVALFSKGTVGALELGIGKDVDLSELFKQGEAGGFSLPKGIVSSNPSAELAKIMANFQTSSKAPIIQNNYLEVPAGANAEEYRRIISNEIERSNRTLVRNGYMGGQ